MEVVSPQIVSGKKVLLRTDIDVPIENGQVIDDFRLRAMLPTLDLCLKNAQEVVMMGHIGRPYGRAVEQLRVAPVKNWLKTHGFFKDLKSGKLTLLENLRFDPREEAEDLGYAKELALLGEIFVNEAFAAHKRAASTTILPTLLPHGAGLRFAQELKTLTSVRENPKKPFLVIMGGVKIEDKLPVIKVLAKIADAVLVGGRLTHEIREQRLQLPANVLVAGLAEDGFDISAETTESWRVLILKAKMVIWNGPLGKFEDPKNDQTKKVAQIVVESSAESIVGGGDTISALNQAGVLDKISFVSVGGGAMLKFLADGTLPTIDALG